MSKVLVTGAAGNIGSALCQALQSLSIPFLGIDIKQAERIETVDMEDTVALERIIHCYRPEQIIHLAAISGIAYCENHKSESERINFELTKNLTNLCARYAVRLLFLSTNLVFKDRTASWQEGEAVCPNTQYGLDKCRAEEYIQKELKQFAIVRTAQVIGHANDYISFIEEQSNKTGAVQAYYDQFTNFTRLADLITALITIIEYNHLGIFHCAGTEVYSKYEFAKKWLKEVNNPTTVTSYPSPSFWPKAVSLNCAKTYALLNFKPKPIF